MGEYFNAPAIKKGEAFSVKHPITSSVSTHLLYSTVASQQNIIILFCVDGVIYCVTYLSSVALRATSSRSVPSRLIKSLSLPKFEFFFRRIRRMMVPKNLVCPMLVVFISFSSLDVPQPLVLAFWNGFATFMPPHANTRY